MIRARAEPRPRGGSREKCASVARSRVARRKKLLRLSVGPRARGRAAHLRGVQEAQEEGVDAEDGGEHLWSESVVRRRAVWSGFARATTFHDHWFDTHRTMALRLYPYFTIKSFATWFAPLLVVTTICDSIPIQRDPHVWSSKSHAGTRAAKEKSFGSLRALRQVSDGNPRGVYYAPRVVPPAR